MYSKYAYYSTCTTAVNSARSQAAVLCRPLPLERDDVGGTLATTAQLDAGPRTGGPGVGGSVGGAEQFGGGQGTQGVRRVVAHGLSAVCQSGLAQLDPSLLA